MHDFDFSSESEDDPSHRTRKRLIGLVYAVSKTTTINNVEPLVSSNSSFDIKTAVISHVENWP